MSLPPAQINVKRRRQDDPVELLYLETDQHHTKRRFTDYCFQRVNKKDDQVAFTSLHSAHGNGGGYRAASTHQASRPPIIRATSPGTEIRDESARRAAQEVLRNRYRPAQDSSEPLPPAIETSSGVPEPATVGESTTLSAPLRHFRLFHDNQASPSRNSAGIQKTKKQGSSWHATIIEKVAFSEVSSNLSDKSLLTTQESNVPDKNAESAANRGTMQFNAASSTVRPIGNTMQDHPSTWDYDSDQLAQELAAFASELSQGQKQQEPAENPKKIETVQQMKCEATIHSAFIFDTFIRVPISDEKSRVRDASKIGLLVIEDQDHNLWQTFAESDSGSEWDEEDPDSNAEDNPANDYPDEELDSEDEYGQGAYENRRMASDDEEYDLNRSWSNSE